MSAVNLALVSCKENADIVQHNTLRDPCAWFADDDIDFFLSKFLNSSQHTHIPPSTVTFLLSASADQINNFPDHYFNSNILFCPVNIENTHWILFVYDKLQLISYFIDPIFAGRHNAKNKDFSITLNQILNDVFNLNVTLREHNYVNLFHQKNNYDCGPLSCAYALLISGDIKYINKDSIISIRQEVENYNASKDIKVSRNHGGGIVRKVRKKKKKAKKSGTNSKPISIIKKINLNNERPCVTYLLQKWFANRPDIKILDPELTHNIISQNHNFIINSISFQRFENIDCVIGIIPNDDFWCLLFYCTKLDISCIFDFQNNLLSDRLNTIGECINDYLNKFFTTKSLTFTKIHKISHSKLSNLSWLQFATAPAN